MHIIKTGRKEDKGGWKLFFRHIFRDHIFESSATLSYYFLFSVFPLTIFISAAFSTLNLSREGFASLYNFIPGKILAILEEYLSAISQGNTVTLIILGITLTLYSMVRAIQTMKRKFRLAYGVSPKLPPVAEWIISVIFVLLILVSFYATLIVTVAGNHLLKWLISVFPLLSDALPSFQILRLFLVTAYLFFVLLGLYYILPGIAQKIRDILPGTLFSLTAWILMSYLFSFYMDGSQSIMTLYGSLEAIIALMTWLYLINVILLLGAYINSYIYLNLRKKL